MASRPIVPQQAAGDGGAFRVGGGAVNNEAKKIPARDGPKNRRALGDIGNLVNLKEANKAKPNPQIHRPLTRSFCAQLAKAENNKACVNVDRASALDGAALPKRAQQKPTAKPPKSVEVIDISPDTEERSPKAKAKNKTRTLTSTLTARSKSACGIANKPKDEIVDIDEADANNHLAAVEYVDDIYIFYKSAENENRPHDYMHMQTDINEKMRAILIDWLIDVHQKFELSPEALYLTINLIDRFLSVVKHVRRRELQLLGISAMLIASKYEEIWPPEVNDLVCIADGAYTHQHVLIMEKTILEKLEWTLTVPTPYPFLARFVKASIPDEKMEHMVYFLAELGMMHYKTIMFCPSMVAASAVYAARCTLNEIPVWTDTLKFHTGYSEDQVLDCAKLLAYFHSKAPESKLHVVYRKYSISQRGAVALLPPAQNLLHGASV